CRRAGLSVRAGTLRVQLADASLDDGRVRSCAGRRSEAGGNRCRRLRVAGRDTRWAAAAPASPHGGWAVGRMPPRQVWMFAFASWASIALAALLVAGHVFAPGLPPATAALLGSDPPP